MTPRHFTPEELSAWLDGELELTADQQAHLKQCQECTRAMERQQSLRRVARQATPQVPSDQMWREIDSRTAGTAPGRSPLGLFDRLRFALRGNPVPAASLATGLAMLAIIVVTRPVPRPIELPSLTPRLVEQAPAETSPAAPKHAAKKEAAPTKRLAKSAEKTSAPQPAAPIPAPQKAESSRATAAEEPAAAAPAANDSVLERRQDVAPSAVAGKAARTRSAAAPSAAAPMATAEAMAPAPRTTWTGRVVVITADRESRPATNRIVMTGHVLILPKVSGSPYVASVNGLTRTLTGQTSASMTEIHLPEETLHLKP